MRPLKREIEIGSDHDFRKTNEANLLLVKYPGKLKSRRKKEEVYW